jgi:hypothetical protein
MGYRAAILIGVGCVLLLVSAYGFGGVLQAASLFVGDRALRNANLWGSVSLVSFLGSIVCFWFAKRRIGVSSRARLVVGGIAVVSAAALLWPVATEFMAVDACRDGGGSFDYTRSVCDREQNHSYVPVFERQGFRIAGSLALVVFGVLVAIPWSSHSGAQRHAL